MRNKLTVRADIIRPLFTAGFALAMALTIGCSSDNDEPNNGAYSPNGGGEFTGTNGNFVDSRDNKSYKWVKIGTQIWLAENLNYAASGKCYDDLESYCEKYGRLYDWATAMTLPPSCNSSFCSRMIQSKHRGICPQDWHIPNDAEWDVLIDAVGGYSTAGWYLKSQNGWNNDGNGDDRYGFSALPGGAGGYSGSGYHWFGDRGIWWSTSENANEADHAYDRYMRHDYERVDYSTDVKGMFYSVRCLHN